jgi:hypothetical protein
LGLPITCTELVIDGGWAGKPKGSLQILFERGWIDKLIGMDIQKRVELMQWEI